MTKNIEAPARATRAQRNGAIGSDAGNISTTSYDGSKTDTAAAMAKSVIVSVLAASLPFFPRLTVVVGTFVRRTWRGFREA